MLHESIAVGEDPKPEKACYFNRELSWLAFNRRVLEQAQDERFPLLERMRFMSFVASNLDEFFEIRVSGLMQQVESDVIEAGADGLGPREQLRRIHNIATSLVSDKYDCWSKELVPALRDAGLVFKQAEELTKAESKWLQRTFDEQIYPVLTPLAVDPGHPFPQLGNKTLNVLAWLDDPTTAETETFMAIIPIPRILPRVLHIDIKKRKNQPESYIFLSEVLKLFAHRLFPGYKLKSAVSFRITRNSDLYFDEEEAENLLKTIEEELFKRQKGAAVRLEIESEVNEELQERLLDAIDLKREYVYRIDGPINLMRLMDVYSLIERPDLKFKPFVPYAPHRLRDTNQIFDAIAQEDVLLHHPYDSFQPFVDWLAAAARDPRVFAIKQTLYRTGSDSPVVANLIEAAKNGKQVTVLVELKARFDEEANIAWARRMEEAGVHVVYGVVGLKTHCKMCLIVRREEGGLRRYAHLGTGNYHSKTARLYTDLGLMTARRDLTEEVAELFNSITGYGQAPKFNKLLAAPHSLHPEMQRLIQRETKNAKEGRPAHIILKINSLVDKESIDNLYEASQAGVQIDLIIRGICCLVPGMKGLSENIRVRSILGRFLEHTRAFYFENDGDKPVMLVGSADWMPRNFFRRVETVFPIEDQRLRRKLWRVIFEACLRDNMYAKVLKSNGSYVKPNRQRGETDFSVQEYLMNQAEIVRKRSESLAARD